MWNIFKGPGKTQEEERRDGNVLFVPQAEAGFKDDFIVTQEEEGAEYNSLPPSTLQVSQEEEKSKGNFLLVAQEPEGSQDDIRGQVVFEAEDGRKARGGKRGPE